jgi:NAD+ diphosphatase
LPGRLGRRRSDALPEGYAWRGLRSLFAELDEALLGLAGRAAQMAEWARTHRFCGACGSGTRAA